VHRRSGSATLSKAPGRPSGPLVGELSGGERTDQGIYGDPDTRRRLGGPACKPSLVVWDPGSRDGPEVFICVVPWVAGGKSGGDEETRTPDPLLAKEMLCQLSYVPAISAPRSGGRTWTRTRDLGLIRAAL
jgi:hypothetical protein